MDQRQKQLETELATLRAKKEAAIRERWDHTINQERLAENIRRNLEQEYVRQGTKLFKATKTRTKN